MLCSRFFLLLFRFRFRFRCCCCHVVVVCLCHIFAREPSPVVNAAINGDLVILDGLDRLSADTLTALQRLIIDREVELFDGTRLVNHMDDDDDDKNTASASNTFQVHPSFRIVAIACPPSSSNPWMTEEVTSWFRTTVLPSPSNKDVTRMITTLLPATPEATMNKALEFSNLLSEMSTKGSATEDKRATGMSNGLSLRQLLRLARHMNSFPNTAEDSLAVRIDDMLMVSVFVVVVVVIVVVVVVVVVFDVVEVLNWNDVAHNPLTCHFFFCHQKNNTGPLLATRQKRCCA